MRGIRDAMIDCLRAQVANERAQAARIEALGGGMAEKAIAVFAARSDAYMDKESSTVPNEALDDLSAALDKWRSLTTRPAAESAGKEIPCV